MAGKKDGEIEADLGGAAFAGQDLSDWNLANVNLSYSDLSMSGFFKADLIGAKLTRADVTRAPLIPRAEAMQISGHRTESGYKTYDISSERRAIRAGEVMAQHLRMLHEQATQPARWARIGHMLDPKIESKLTGPFQVFDLFGADERT